MVNCKNCGKKITSKEDINILAFLGVKATPFCNNCYSGRERGFLRNVTYVPRNPINSTVFLISLWVSTFFVPVFLFILFAGDRGEVPQFFIILMSIIVLLAFSWNWFLWFKARSIVNSLR